MAGFTIKPDKFVFTTQQISFLGHLISPAGVHPPEGIPTLM
jgi:hypothetical protein